MATAQQLRQLFQACADGDVDSVRKFLPQNANQANDRGWTKAGESGRFGKKDIENASERSSLQNSTVYGAIFGTIVFTDRLFDVMHYLALPAVGIDRAHSIFRNIKPLHFAARFGHLSVVQVLLTAGAKPSTTDKDGRTPLELATFWGHSEIANLIRGGATSGATPLVSNAKTTTVSPVARSPPVKLSALPKTSATLKSASVTVTTQRAFTKTAKTNNLETTTKALEDGAGGVGEELVDLKSALNEYTNFFAGNPLKRLSEKRTDPAFISKLLIRPSTRYLIFHGDQALFHSPATAPRNGPAQLHFLSYEDVQTFVDLDGRSKRQWVFLGVDDADVVDETAGRARGRAYVALDLSTGKGDDIGGEDALLKTRTAQGGKLSHLRPAAFRLSPSQAAILGEGNSMIDWNVRRRHCPGCGRRTYSEEAGFKRVCGPMPAGQKPCITAKGLNNFQHPRSDPVVIVAIVSKDGNRVFLGRNKNFPPKQFSCIAGFMEPGESIEECVRREVREETGISISRSVIHSSQPWPFPSQLMIGCIAVAETEKFEPEEEELAEAKWFDRESVLAALHASSPLPGYKPTTKVDFGVPASFAIAHVLLKAWATGEVDVQIRKAAKL
ncbi:NADH pyrophosphatase [Gonapodya sp. JEL0774]|nr:NADH pyrophosphatase [Gonapodya sp. JEL0774]